MYTNTFLNVSKLININTSLCSGCGLWHPVTASEAVPAVQSVAGSRRRHQPTDLPDPESVRGRPAGPGQEGHQEENCEVHIYITKRNVRYIHEYN